ncbi:MAG: transposase [Proteobacteria bacterium]|nr:transposase [Pseudomonadota bacterium]
MLAQADAHGAGYPAFVRKEFERYLRCGRLAGGFSRLVCKACGFNHLLAFSCKGRLCPSCANRRMEQTALFLSAKVLPKVAYRQWTVSLPWRIHWQVGTNTKLLSAALSVVLRSLFAWQRRVARRVGIAQPLCGSVTFIHRFNSQLLLSPHFHALVPDGVFSVDEGGALGFAQLPPPRDDEVEALLRRIGDRIEALVQQQCADAIDDDDPDALQHSLAEATQAPRRHPWQTHPAPQPPARPRCFALDGYSLHADVAVAAEDRRGLRRLLRYGARPALAARRVSLLEGMVVYRLRKPTATGRTQLQMTPQQFIRRLAALTPPPWLNLIRFYGVFASAHRQRQAIAQRVAQQLDPADDPFACPPLRPQQSTDRHDAPSSAPPPHLRIAWSELLRRTFDDPLVCPRCQRRMRLIAVVKDPDAIAAILAHPAHRDDDPGTGPDPPQLPPNLEPQPELFQSRPEPLQPR